MKAHYDGKRFFNPDGARVQPVWMLPRLFAAKRARWPKRVPVETRRPPAPNGDDAVITFIGHASFLLQTATGNLIAAPMYSKRATPVQFAGPRRVREPGVRFEDLPPIT